ncbi:hypothetical protein [Streptomyces indiaensis]|uniref:hypothetical protein n=1 Tax=Streptomyces indiaensis TaxID=284033 RepID=UPI001F2EB7F3|nr:hypothetical protein [Streptomyces indiaensis]MCF1645982.1 hypothetical protein [Streptomyces indiaensis]
MNESTQTQATAGTPTSYGFCSWHNRFADDVRLIDVVEQGSGSGGVQYACGPCRREHHLVPFADRA